MLILKIIGWTALLCEIIFLLNIKKICHDNKKIRHFIVGNVILPFNFFFIGSAVFFIFTQNMMCFEVRVISVCAGIFLFSLLACKEIIKFKKNVK